MARASGRGTDASALLERGRTAYRERAWADAYDALARADGETPLGPDDLERLAWAAALCGRDDELYSALERLHDLRERAGDLVRAARAAFWIGFRLSSSGEVGRGSAWISRAARLLERHAGKCVEQGYLRLPEAFALIFRQQNPAAAVAVAREAAAIGEHSRTAISPIWPA